MHISDSTTNHRRICATLSEDEINDALIELVRKKAGVEGYPLHVARCHVSINGGGMVIRREATVELVIDLDALPTAG